MNRRYNMSVVEQRIYTLLAKLQNAVKSDQEVEPAEVGAALSLLLLQHSTSLVMVNNQLKDEKDDDYKYFNKGVKLFIKTLEDSIKELNKCQ
jgi:hypothetical protein